jgi:hypothetical protein
MAKDIIDKIGSLLDRRHFLGRTLTGAGALAAGIFVKPKEAEACPSHCCGLCFGELGGGDMTNCACTWSWTCCSTTNKLWRCSECFSQLPPGCPNGCPTEDCDCRVCTNVKGSKFQFVSYMNPCEDYDPCTH